MTNQWGNYYTNDTEKVVDVSNLDKAKTLSLYLYGIESLPNDPADYIRPVNAERIVAKVDGQAYYDGIGAIIPNIVADKSDDIPAFFAGDYDQQFISANTNGASRVVQSASQIGTGDWKFDFAYVNYGGYEHWEDGTFIYNNTNFRFDPSTRSKNLS